MVIPCYANLQTITNLKNNFGYIFDGVYSAGGKPQLELYVVENNFDFDGINIIPVEINHAQWMILGYRIGNVAYLTDCSGVPDESLEKLMGLELLIISALRYTEHPAHFNIEQAVEMAQKINPKLAVFTHMGHEVDYDTLLSELPDNIVPAYDGMEVELDEL
jgi:phosphoribosyl 1,2-cyclic phosphate phosphodiesterase